MTVGPSLKKAERHKSFMAASLLSAFFFLFFLNPGGTIPSTSMNSRVGRRQFPCKIHDVLWKMERFQMQIGSL